MASARGASAVVLVAALVCAGCGEPVEPPVDGGPACTADEACDDGLFCNGVERCLPSDPSAGADGCVAAEEPACAAGEMCVEAARECEACIGDPDADGDGHDSVACGGDDCDDGDGDRFPGNAEVCDALHHDEDCDPASFGRVDADRDLHFSAACCNTDDSGAMFCGNDCDDDEPRANIEAAESCDGIDNDCDGVVDGADATESCNRLVGGTGAVCESASCGCPEEDSVTSGGRCDLLPPRAVAPLSTTRASSRGLELRWIAPPRSEEVELEVCADRECAEVLATVRTADAHATLPATITADVIFWRLHSVAHTVVSPLASRAWELRLPRIDAPHASAAGSVFDADLDGRPDMLAGTPAAVVTDLAAAGGVTVFRGNGFDFTAGQQLEGRYYDGRLGTHVANVGDLDGNGYPDIAATVPGVGKLFVYLGTSAGFPDAPSIELDETGVPSALGDVDGDGYADWASADEAPSASAPASRIVVRYGGPDGAGPREPTELDYSADGWSTTGGVLGAGDVNGDGYGDLIVTRSQLSPVTVPFRNVTQILGYAAVGPARSLTGVTGAAVAEVHLGGPAGLETIPTAMRSMPAFMALTVAGNFCDSALGITLSCEPVNIRPYMPYVATAGDLDGDGYSDVVVAHGAMEPTDLLGAELTPCSTISIPGSGTYCVGDPDDVVQHTPAFLNHVEVGWGGPAGVAEWTRLEGSFRQMGLAAGGAGDVTGDGLDDLAVSVAIGTQPSFAIYEGRGDRALEATFTTAAALPSGGGTYQMPDAAYRAVPLGDVDGDGADDVLSPIHITSGITLDVLYGNPGGLHLARWTTTLPSYSAGLVSACAASDGLEISFLGPSLTGLVAGTAAPLSVLDTTSSTYVAITDPITSLACDTDAYAVMGQPAFDSTTGADSGRLIRAQSASSGTTLQAATTAGVRLGAGIAASRTLPRVAATISDGRVRVTHTQTGATLATLPAIAGVTRSELAFAGDLNGDSYEDLAAGSPDYGGGAGRVEIFFGDATAVFSAAPDVVLDGAAAEGLGARIVAAGDLDDDSVADLAVHGSGGMGSVSIYRGSPTAMSTAPVVRLLGTASSAGLGTAMSGELDADGDGHDDLFLSAPLHRDARFVPNVGAVYLVHGAADLSALTPTLVAEGVTANQRIGSDVLCRRLDLDADLDCAAIDASGGTTQFFGGHLARGSRMATTTAAGSAASGF